MKYYIIAGEASGDLHGSNLIKELKLADPSAEIRFWGGDKMSKAAGEQPIKHYKDLAFMGVWEVVKNLRVILKNITFCKADILSFNPDALIFIDYPGFNIKIAKWAKKKGFLNHYYIAPKVWAWNEKRVKSMPSYIDHLYIILPFEKSFFKKHRMPAHYVGNPLVKIISNYQAKPLNLKEHKPIIALLPGSRKHEVEKILPTFVKAANYFREYQFVIAGISSLATDIYKPFINSNVEIIFDQTYDLLSASKAALVASGTATLETALFKVPQLVCYKTSLITYHIGKWLVKIKFISLVNLIMDKEVVKELIQHNCNESVIAENLKQLLTEPKQILADYDQLQHLLEEKDASKHVATKVFETLSVC